MQSQRHGGSQTRARGVGQDLCVWISKMARQMLILVPLSLTFFVPLAFAGRLHLSFWPAFGIGLSLVTAAVTAYLWFTR
jgi:hypothetical protein